MFVINLKISLYVKLLFFLYISVVLFVSLVNIESIYLRMIIFQPLIEAQHNLIPFTTIGNYIINFHNYNFDIWFFNIIGNILLFVPMGVLLPILSFKFRKFFPSIILVILFSLTVELLQYATQLGVFDVDDIILNALGGSIGFLIYIIMKRRMS